MPYVSARYAPPPPLDMPMARGPGDPKQVIATDSEGVEWWLDEASEVGDWLRYREGGGTIDPYIAPKTAKKEKRK